MSSATRSRRSNLRLDLVPLTRDARRRWDNAQANGSGQTDLATYTQDPVARDTARVETSGATITAKVNLSTLGSQTDSTYASGQPGIAVYDPSGGIGMIESWRLGTLGHLRQSRTCS